MNLRQHIKNIIKEELNESLLDNFSNFFRSKKSLEVNPQTIQSEKERFTCQDCGEYNYDMYMVNDAIWKKYGNDKLTLCQSCLEKRMNSKLNKSDFYQYKDVPANKHNPKVKDMMEEGELTEKCWKGYTQKGMKTMFGKRYPNCVKIKKKKTIKESIRTILIQEVNNKYSKPTEKLEKVVYKWLDNYFEDSQIYKEEYWKYHGFRFEFCKNGREIADLRIVFDDNSPDWGPSDKRPTSERSVKEVMLYIYPIMIDELITDIPIRKNYLLYLIEEWFEDTKLNEIQKEFNRSDMSLDYVTVFNYKKRGDLCVPPVSKPDDVSMQEMMDYINKNTLFSYKDMEEHEDEEPGWIENMYLSKLHSKEQERVNQEDRENNPEPFNDDY